MRFGRTLKHLKFIFGIPETWKDPNLMGEGIMLTHDALGTSVLEKKDQGGYKAWYELGDGSTSLDTEVVPEGKLWFVPYCHARHDDVTTQRYVLIGVRAAWQSGAANVNLVSAGPITQYAMACVPRPFLVPSGSLIGVSSPSGMSATGGLLLCAFVYVLNVGEYVMWPG